MTRFVARGSLALLTTFTAALAVAGPLAAAPFTDKNLEAAVRAVLQDTKAELTDQLLNNVFVLDASGKQVASLAGLEKCKNLAQFKATNNQIADVKPLAGLTNLQSLDLAGNKIVDLAPLAGLTKLQYLELTNNQVTNLTPLAGLSALSSLYLNGNKVVDVAPLAKLTRLSSLSLGKNQLVNFVPLAAVNRLMVLDLNDNQIADLAPLAKQGELSILLLERNKLVDLAPLVAMAKADAEGAKRFAPYLRLYLTGNPLSEAAKTTQLAELKKYGVRINPTPTDGTAGSPAAPANNASAASPFNGKDLTGWKTKQPEAKSKWKVGVATGGEKADQFTVGTSTAPGTGQLVNASSGGVDIFTVEKFGDCLIELEFMYPKGSNSGVYVHGEYEIQILDSFGKDKVGPGDLGGLYGASAPKVNASKKPGEWQKFAIDFQAPKFEGGKKVGNARFLKVVLNDQLIHENVEMKGPTPSGVTGKEEATGPLMFQGDHGPVAFRNVKITPRATK